jgi:hypothetical protein
MEVRKLEMLPTMIEQIRALVRNAADPEAPYEDRLRNRVESRPKYEQLLAFLPADGSWVRLKDLVKSCPAKADLTYKYLDHLIRRGKAETTGNPRDRYVRRTPQPAVGHNTGSA